MDGRNIATTFSDFVLRRIFTDFWHQMSTRGSPGPSPRLLPGFYLDLAPDFEVLEGKTYQKPTRKKPEKTRKIPLESLYILFKSLFWAAIFLPSTVFRLFFGFPCSDLDQIWRKSTWRLPGRFYLPRKPLFLQENLQNTQKRRQENHKNQPKYFFIWYVLISFTL